MVGVSATEFINMQNDDDFKTKVTEMFTNNPR